MDINDFMGDLENMSADDLPDERLKKYYKLLQEFTKPTFNALYFTKLMPDSLKSLKENLIKREEYEKVIIVDKIIENNWTGLEHFEESYRPEHIFQVQKLTSDFMDKLESGMKPDNPELKEIASKLHDINHEMIVNSINKRIQTIKNREFNPFDSGKLYHMFEYYRSESLKYHEKMLEDFEEASNAVKDITKDI